MMSCLEHTQDETSTPVSSSQVRGDALGSPMLAFSPLKNAEDRKLPGSVLDVVSSGFVELTKRQRQQLLVHLFHKWLKLDVPEELNTTYVPHDFLPLLSSAVRVLFVNGKTIFFMMLVAALERCALGKIAQRCHYPERLLGLFHII